MIFLLLRHWLVIALLLLGGCFLGAWIVLYRFRYPYVGCLGGALLLLGIRRGFGLLPLAEDLMLGAAIVLLSWMVLLMVRHSLENVRRLEGELEAGHEERLRRLVSELEDLAERPSKGTDHAAGHDAAP